jgi:Ca-activated chloride channel family protein
MVIVLSVQLGMKTIFGLVFLVCLGFQAVGSGLIIVHEPGFWRPIPPPQHSHSPPLAPTRLETVSLQASVKVKDQVAETSIEQEFYNPNSRRVEGTFLFPVPKGAAISKFSMEINGKQVEAELLAADKARSIYENIVRKLQDPALLEYAGRDVFKVRIFPIEAHGKKRVHLSYSQVLKADTGLVNYILPLKAAAKSLSLKVDLQGQRPLKSIYSPSHNVEVKRHSPTKATIGYEAAQAKSDSDFHLYYSMENSDVALDLLSYRKPGEDGYFLLLASPGLETKTAKVIPKDVMFVIDTSGSMAGAKLEQAKKALAFCVENLNESDRFEIVRFATEVETLFGKLADASGDQRSRAQGFIKELKPTGGTAINDALQKALALRADDGERPFVIVFLTDGRPTIGVTSEDTIVENVSKSNRANTRIFCFGIGTDVNTHLLDKITEQTKAFSQYVLPEEDIEVKVSSFFSKIKEPVLANPKLTFPDAIRATKMYPSPVPDLFKGDQVVLVGRYSGHGSGAIEIAGMVDRTARKFAEDAKFPEESSSHEFIPRLWAMRRVGYLLDEIRLHGDNKELKDEVTELARKYGIVTPYTAYLIIEDEKHRGIPELSRSVRLQDGPAGAADHLYFFNQQKERDGAGAVGNARSYLRLKQADSAEALALGNEEAIRGAITAATPLPSMIPARRPEGIVALQKEVRTRSDQYGQQARFAGGRAFYQNGPQWVDSEVQMRQNAKRQRVQFNSDEYFDLLKNQPQAAQWAAVGRNVQFVLKDTVYEIHE